MVTSYHSRKDKQKLQGKSGAENRCCDTLVWGCFSQQETGLLSFMWWGQDVHLALSLCSLISSPQLPPSKPRSLPLQEATFSPVCETGRGETGRRPQPWNGVLSKAPPAPTQTSRALSTCSWLSPWHAGRGCGTWLCPGTWCDTCSPCRATFLLCGVVLLQGDTLGLFPVLLFGAPDGHRYY